MDLFFLIGGHYEKKGGEITKYYGVYPEPRRRAGASRIAVRKYTVPQSTTLNYLSGDHLGSTSLAVNASTGDVVTTRYREASRRDKPWGEVRWTSENKTLPTRYTFTGQYSYISDSATDLSASASFGLMFYNARWYDPMTGRFAQADSIMPGGVQGLDRYAYVANNPVRYYDPSGHKACDGKDAGGDTCSEVTVEDYADVMSTFFGWELKGKWSLRQVSTLIDTGLDMANAFGGWWILKRELKGVRIHHTTSSRGSFANAHDVYLNPRNFNKWTIVHEMAHAWDAVNGYKLSKGMQTWLLSEDPSLLGHFFFPKDPDYWFDPGWGPPVAGIDSNTDHYEDFAEAIAGFVYSDTAASLAVARGWSYNDPSRGYSYSGYLETPRGQYIFDLISSLSE